MTSLGKSSKKNSILSETSGDVIFSEDTVIIQPKKGYRFNSDSMILSWFIHKILIENEIKDALEIGAGTGIISIVLKKRGFKPQITCVEVQEDMFFLLSKNIINNNLSDDLLAVHEDFRIYADNVKAPVDLIFSNPPFFGISTGKINENSTKALCRHEFFGTLNDFFISSTKILKKNGHFIFVYPISRIQYALGCARSCNLMLKNICFFRENNSVAPSSFTAHLVYKSSESSSCPELITMRDETGGYSQTGKKIMYYQN